MIVESEANVLKKIAREAIEHALVFQEPLAVDTPSMPVKLQQNGASFVTLYTTGKKLRGCIGSLIAHRPLVEDVAHNAYAAAFSDPRFPPVTAEEFEDVILTISVLSIPKPISFASESELLDRLRPNIDGLILVEGDHRGTFLPAVWASLPTRAEFLNHLKRKAGLPSDYWSDTIKVFRYTTEVL